MSVARLPVCGSGSRRREVGNGEGVWANPFFSVSVRLWTTLIFNKRCNERRSDMLRKQKNRLSPVICPRPRWRILRRSHKPPSRLGRGILCPHSLRPYPIAGMLTRHSTWVQKRATKLVINLKKIPYTNRLQRLKLPNMKYRRLRGW